MKAKQILKATPGAFMVEVADTNPHSLVFYTRWYFFADRCEHPIEAAKRRMRKSGGTLWKACCGGWDRVEN